MNTLTWQCALSPTDDLASLLNDERYALIDQFAMNLTPIDIPDILRQGVVDVASGANTPNWEQRVNPILDQVAFTLSLSTNENTPFQIKCLDNDGKTYLISLFLSIGIARRIPGYQLRRCLQDGRWFLPSSHATVSKFCSTPCRNRHNYEQRSLGSKFVCAHCSKIYSISLFSGLSLTHHHAEPTDSKAPEPLCAHCVRKHYPQWTTYVASAHLAELPQIKQKDETDEYARQINILISNAIALADKPLHYKKIAAYVTERIAIRGRDPEMSILGYLLRSPDRYRPVRNRTFELVKRSAKVQTASIETLNIHEGIAP